MSKNKYILPFNESFYIEFGGTRKKDSHSWDVIPQRYAYDFEIRDDQNKPYHDDYLEKSNYNCNFICIRSWNICNWIIYWTLYAF